MALAASPRARNLVLSMKYTMLSATSTSASAPIRTTAFIITWHVIDHTLFVQIGINCTEYALHVFTRAT